MIIIFNLMGAVVAILGLMLGVVLLFATGKLSIALLGVLAIWCWLGRSKLDEETGERSVAPSVFFIPLFFWGLLAGVAVVPAVFIDFAVAINKGRELPGRDSVVGDPRAAQFREDEDRIEGNPTDDPELSEDLRSMMSEFLPRKQVNILVRSSPDAVLILVKTPELKKVEMKARPIVLAGIQMTARMRRPDVKVYAGLKGRVAFGAVLTPDMPAKTGSVVSPDPLYAFYSTLPNPENVGSTTMPESDSEPADAERPANIEGSADPIPDSE